jgi:hypothetical protein
MNAAIGTAKSRTATTARMARTAKPRLPQAAAAIERRHCAGRASRFAHYRHNSRRDGVLLLRWAPVVGAAGNAGRRRIRTIVDERHKR